MHICVFKKYCLLLDDLSPSKSLDQERYLFFRVVETVFQFLTQSELVISQAIKGKWSGAYLPRWKMSAIWRYFLCYRDAFKYWCQALDETLNIADALNTWQELGFPKDGTDCFAVGRSTDMSQKLLSQAGPWGCLHAAVLVAKIAQ